MSISVGRSLGYVLEPQICVELGILCNLYILDFSPLLPFITFSCVKSQCSSITIIIWYVWNLPESFSFTKVILKSGKLICCSDALNFQRPPFSILLSCCYFFLFWDSCVPDSSYVYIFHLSSAIMQKKLADSLNCWKIWTDGHPLTKTAIISCRKFVFTNRFCIKTRLRDLYNGVWLTAK